MTQPNANSSSFNPQRPTSSDRCRHYSPAGRRCRIPANPSGLCAKHQADNSAEVAATLTAGLDDFSSAEQVNTFLARLLLLAAQDKISMRRAGTLTYIASQLLNSISTLIKENKSTPPEIIVDIGRPGGPHYSDDTCPDETRAQDASAYDTSDTLRQLGPLAKVPA